MANRELPELRSRLRLDTTEAEARAKASARRIIAAFDDPKAMEGLAGRVDAFSTKADEFGSKMTRNVTLPVVAAGAAAFTMAKDFNTSFTQMQTLAGVTAGEVDGLKSSVMDLTGATAQSPQELARALYFVRSSGLEGADAMETLEASAKGSAIGLGETAGIADVATSALNTYGSENLSATQAVDMLAAAVAQGKGEAADFAPQLGNLLPIAQKLGVGFDQVAGSVAFLTQTNGDVARSSTSVAGVFQKLLSPTEQGAKVLDSVGLSAEKVRQYLAENGLIATLQMLNESLGGNSDQLRKVFDDIEGFNGVLGLLRNGGADASKVIDEVSNSAGYLDGAFQKVNQTDEFKFQQALADLQATAVEVGQDIIPLFTDVASAIGGIVNGFTSLPAPVQTGVLTLAALAAVLGPVAKGVSLAADGVGLLIKVARSEALSNFALGLGGVTAQSGGAANALGGLVATAAASPVAWGAAAVGVGALVYAFTQMESQAEQTQKAAENLAASAEAAGITAEEQFRRELARTLAGRETGGLDQAGNVDSVARGIRAAKLDAEELGNALLGTQDQYDAMVAQAKATADALRSTGNGTDAAQAAQIEFAIEAFGRWRDQAVEAKLSTEELAEIEKALGIETSTTTGAIEGNTDALGGNTDALSEAADQARALFDARQEVQSTAEDVTAAEGDLADAHQETADRERAAAEASRAVGDARRAAAQADREAAEAARAIGVARTEGARAVRDADLAVTAAERDQAIAIANTRLEQEGLTQARQDAVRSLEDLQRSNRGDVLSEKEARLALKEAQRDLRRAKPSEREGAALRVERAQLALESAIVRAQDSTAELATRRAAGVEGSPEVIAQQDRITAAQRAEEEAGQRLTAAQEAAADARVAAADRVRDAQDRLASAQDRQREAGERIVAARAAVVEAHDAITEAAGREKEADDKVTTAEGLHVEAQGTLAGLLFGNAGKIDVLVRKYSEQANALDPNSPLRKNLEAYIADLQRALDLETVRQTIGSGPGGGIPPTRDPDRGAGPGRSSFPGGKATPKLTVPNVTGRAGPRLAPAASGSALPPIQVGPFYIDGNPDEGALRQLERIAERAVESGLRKVATR